MPNKHIRLVTRGDDAGMCRTVNVAIRDAYERGILRNVGLMVPAPAFEDAVEMLSGLDDVCVGLHLDLTAEWAHVRWGPVLPPEDVPSLVDAEGYFFHTTQALHANHPVLAQMQAEVRAQLEKARVFGVNVAYLDEHMGIGWIAGLGAWLSEFCAQEGLIYSHDLSERGLLQELPSPAEPTGNSVDDLIARLDVAESGTYLIVGHPVYKTGEIMRAHLPGQAPGIEAESRDWQRRMFMDEKIVAYCRDRGIEAIRYTDVA